jgi:hypothetical protein
MFVDEETLVVNICPYNSLGEIIDICGLKIQLPKVPDKKYILFSDKPTHEQRWERHDPPEALMSMENWDDFSELPEHIQSEYMPYIKREVKRRKVGVWFMNNGTPTYLTGTMYMYLQWDNFGFDANGGHPYFFHFQWLWHIHAEACEVDDNCFGQIVGKNRRFGWTSMAAAKQLNKMTTLKGKHSGAISKNEEDAKTVIFETKVFKVLKSWPFFFVPINDTGTTLTSNYIRFVEPTRRKTHNRKKLGKTDALGSTMSYKATKNNAYDGSKLADLIVDEGGKLEKPANLIKFIDVHKPTLMDRYHIKGKMWLGTTVEEMERGGKAFKDVYYDSLTTKRSANKRTKSGLYKFFISSLDTQFIDVYGMPIVKDPKEPTLGIDGHYVKKGSESYFKNELSAIKNDPSKVNEFKRLFPIIEEDMFRDLSNNSINAERIWTQIEYNKSIEQNQDPLYERGFFYWEGERFHSNVKWKEDPVGNWAVSMFLKEEHQNKNYVKGGVVHPSNKWLGASGVDPYRVDVVSYGNGSNASCHMFTRFNMEYPSNVCFARYNGRPSSLYIASEQILMGHIYFGVQALIESNVDVMIRHWCSLGYDGYLMRKPPRLTPKGSKTANEFGLPTSGDSVRAAHLLAMQTYVNEYVGLLDDGTMGSMYFNDTLIDVANYDMHNAEKHDDAMSFGIGLLAIQQDVGKVVKETVNQKPIIRMYDVSGNVSKALGGNNR